MNARRIAGGLAVAAALTVAAVNAENIIWPKPKALWGWTITESTPQVNEQAVRTFQRGTGRMAVGHMAGTVEGDPIFQYVLVDGRRVRLVNDGRQDRFGSGRIWERTLDSISLGYQASGELESPPRYAVVPPDSAGSAGQALALLCWVGSDVICRFDHIPGGW